MPAASPGDSKMLKLLIGTALAMTATQALAGSVETNFGVRTVGGELPFEAAQQPAAHRSSGAAVDLRTVAGIGAQWGRVTSTLRSHARNRAVGGVRNSFHLTGRAIDIARRPGVSHWQIAAAYRNAGYHLIESLDEGDHSHFAFGSPGSARYARLARPAAATKAAVVRQSPTQWRVVTAASAVLR